MIRWALAIILTLHVSCLVGQAAERVESEYKLAIPNDQSEDLWLYLTSKAFLSNLEDGGSLTTKVSVEEFVDVYYDDEFLSLYEQEVGLRYRSRYLGDSLLKRLIQLKTPLAADGVARTETKYELKKSKDKNDLYARHQLLKLVKKKDRNNLNYQLARFGTESNSMQEEVKLRQTRSRIYITDSIASLATITLDEVSNLQFPFQKYVEMELELNEIRYTNSGEDVKKRMEAFNRNLRNSLQEAFPSLVQDQTPKYNKMKDLIDQSHWSVVYSRRMWIALAGLVMFAVYLLVTEK